MIDGVPDFSLNMSADELSAAYSQLFGLLDEDCDGCITQDQYVKFNSLIGQAIGVYNLQGTPSPDGIASNEQF